MIPASEILTRTFTSPVDNFDSAAATVPFGFGAGGGGAGANNDGPFHIMPKHIMENIRPVKPRSLVSHDRASRDALLEAQKRQYVKTRDHHQPGSSSRTPPATVLVPTATTPVGNFDSPPTVIQALTDAMVDYEVPSPGQHRRVAVEQALAKAVGRRDETW
jgi:hypothetical protein